MYNYAMLVGKVSSFQIEVDEVNEEIKGGVLTIKVSWDDEKDIFTIKLNKKLTSMTKDIIKEDCLVGLKCHLKNDNDKIILICDKITLISDKN